MRWFNKDKMSFWTRVKLCWYVFTKGSLPAKLKEYRSRHAQKQWNICEQRRIDMEVASRPRTDCPESEYMNQ